MDFVEGKKRCLGGYYVKDLNELSCIDIGILIALLETETGSWTRGIMSPVFFKYVTERIAKSNFQKYAYNLISRRGLVDNVLAY